MLRFEATTSVPKLQLTDRGFVVPSEPDVLAGVQPISTRLWWGCQYGPRYPAGQIAMTMSAIIADCHDQLVALLNGLIRLWLRVVCRTRSAPYISCRDYPRCRPAWKPSSRHAGAEAQIRGAGGASRMADGG